MKWENSYIKNVYQGEYSVTSATKQIEVIWANMTMLCSKTYRRKLSRNISLIDHSFHIAWVRKERKERAGKEQRNPRKDLPLQQWKKEHDQETKPLLPLYPPRKFPGKIMLIWARVRNWCALIASHSIGNYIETFLTISTKTHPNVKNMYYKKRFIRLILDVNNGVFMCTWLFFREWDQGHKPYKNNARIWNKLSKRPGHLL